MRVNRDCHIMFIAIQMSNTNHYCVCEIRWRPVIVKQRLYWLLDYQIVFYHPETTKRIYMLISVMSKQFLSIPIDLQSLLILFSKGVVAWCSDHGANSMWHCIACPLYVNYTVFSTPVMSYVAFCLLRSHEMYPLQTTSPNQFSYVNKCLLSYRLWVYLCLDAEKWGNELTDLIDISICFVGFSLWCSVTKNSKYSVNSKNPLHLLR